jgi:hypothetical protein
MDEREFLWKAMVEAAGGVWVGVQYGSKTGDVVILFQAPPEKEDERESTIALYGKALRSVADVEMAVKNYLESKRLVKVVGL